MLQPPKIGRPEGLPVGLLQTPVAAVPVPPAPITPRHSREIDALMARYPNLPPPPPHESTAAPDGVPVPTPDEFAALPLYDVTDLVPEPDLSSPAARALRHVTAAVGRARERLRPALERVVAKLRPAARRFAAAVRGQFHRVADGARRRWAKLIARGIG